MDIHGFCDARFARVREVFETNFSERGDVGASFAATVDGEYVVDLWAGHADAAKTRPWTEDTIVNVFSTTKTMTFLTALMLADQGKLDLDAPVIEYWPEYGQKGKEKTLVRHFLSHTAGVPGFAPAVTAAELYDWDTCTANLAAQEPWWEPGSRSGYHANTQGYLIGELVRRITGKSFGTYFRETVAGPLGADFHVGLAPADFPRVAEMIPPKQNGEMTPPMDPSSITARVFSSAHVGNNDFNSPGWRQAEIPAANGHGNARSVVRAQTALANGGSAFGVNLLSEAGCRRMLEEQIDGTDAVLMMPIRFGMGYAFPNALMPMSPPSQSGMFWGGGGGSTIVVDPEHHVCLSYVMNQMAPAMVGDSRGGSLGKVFYDALQAG